MLFQQLFHGTHCRNLTKCVAEIENKFCNLLLLANEVCRKVMFLHLSVIMFTVATKVGGEHPTGMFIFIFLNIIDYLFKV